MLPPSSQRFQAQPVSLRAKSVLSKGPILGIEPGLCNPPGGGLSVRSSQSSKVTHAPERCESRAASVGHLVSE